MPKRHNRKLDQLARRERVHFVLVVLALPTVVILGLFALLMHITGPRDPLSRTYIGADVISVSDMSSGTGVAFEVVAQFAGLQKVFQTDDPVIVAGLPDRLCVMETRGVQVGEDVPRPRYHALADPARCDLP